MNVNTWYLIKYRLYEINNVIYFETFSQYQNWLDTMERAFKNWFEVTEIHTYEM